MNKKELEALKSYLQSLVGYLEVREDFEGSCYLKFGIDEIDKHIKKK